MNATLKAVVDTYKVAPVLTHSQEIKRLYRKSLRTLKSWAENRALFNEEATKIRNEFNANINLPKDSPETVRLVNEAKKRLQDRAHPDPYIVNYMPGGSLFMRNPAIPLEALYPLGIPEGISQRVINIDMSNVEKGQKYANRVFVDSVNKTYYIDK